MNINNEGISTDGCDRSHIELWRSRGNNET